MKKYNSFEEKDWNINKGFIDELSRLIHEVNVSAKAGDIKSWFNDLRILYRSIHGDKRVTELKKESKNRIEIINENMKKLSVMIDNYENETQVVVKMQRIKTIKQALDSIDIMIKDVMYESKIMDFIVKKDERLPIYR